MTGLFEHKTALVCGARSRAVVRSFARGGAAVFLAERTREPLEAVAAPGEQAGASL